MPSIMKFLFVLAQLSSICFASKLHYKDVIANKKYGFFGSQLATSGKTLVIGAGGMGPSPVFVVEDGKMAMIPPVAGALLSGINVAANEQYIVTNAATGTHPPPTGSVLVYSAAKPHKLVARFPVENQGFIGPAIGEDNTIVVTTERSMVLFYSYDGQGSWSKTNEFDIGRHPLYPSRTVTISGNYAAIGSCIYNGGGEGSAEIFERVKGTWQHVQSIKTSDYRYFGAQVVLRGKHLAVAAMKGNNEQHVFIYRRNDASGKWLEEDHLTIPSSPKAGYSPTFGIDLLIGAPHMLAVSTKDEGDVATKIFTESKGKWTEHASLTAEPLDPVRQSNAAVHFGNNNIVYTGRINPYLGGHKGGQVFVHDLSKIVDNE